MVIGKHTLPVEFKQWYWKDNENRVLIFLTFVAIAVLFPIFKYYYPYPNFLPDSYSYLEAAVNNVSINLWPVGYSKFLRFISVFNHTDTGLALIQYTIMQSCILFFIFTIRYLLQPGTWVIRVLWMLLVLNPLWLYISNFVSSDALFASLSLLWLTTLLWILYQPVFRLFIVHSLILVFVFSVRYNALYYPIISAAVILLLRGNYRTKLINIGIVLIPVSIFFIYTIWAYKEKTGIAQFSAFGGWQMGANALFMYAHVPINKKEPVPDEFKKIHFITIKHMDSLSHVKRRPDSALGIYYLWDEQAPLKLYMEQKWRNNPKRDSTSYLKQWASVAPLYSRYGTWLIKKHPEAYVLHYLYPNLMNYYSPTTEFLGIDNMGADSVDNGAVTWFGYKTNKVKSRFKDRTIKLTLIFPPMLALFNIIFFLGFLGFWFLDGFKKVSIFYKKALWLMVVVWIFNLGFSVIASPIVLRYQAFPFVFILSFASILLGFLIKESRTESVPQRVSSITSVPDTA